MSSSVRHPRRWSLPSCASCGMPSPPATARRQVAPRPPATVRRRRRPHRGPAHPARHPPHRRQRRRPPRPPRTCRASTVVAPRRPLPRRSQRPPVRPLRRPRHRGSSPALGPRPGRADRAVPRRQTSRTYVLPSVRRQVRLVRRLPATGPRRVQARRSPRVLARARRARVQATTPSPPAAAPAWGAPRLRVLATTPTAAVAPPACRARRVRGLVAPAAQPVRAVLARVPVPPAAQAQDLAPAATVVRVGKAARAVRVVRGPTPA